MALGCILTQLRRAILTAGTTALLGACGMGIDHDSSRSTDQSQPESADDSDLKIRAGTLDTANAYSSVVKITMTSSSGSSFCSGAILGPRAVLTAAHCVYDGPALLSPDKVSVYEATGRRAVSARLVRPHPGYDLVGRLLESNDVPVASFGVDLAVIEFEEDLGYRQIYNLATTFPTQGTPLVGVGFGETEKGSDGLRRYGTMEVLGYAPLSDGTTSARVERAQLFVLPGKANQIICRGDSGGPILNAGGSILGVTSGGTFPLGTSASRICASFENATYTATPGFRDWIYQAAPSLAWTNPSMRHDVNGDGRISPMDALIVINRLNDPSQYYVLPAAKPAAGSFFYDVNSDGRCTALDALLVINALNSSVGPRTTISGATASTMISDGLTAPGRVKLKTESSAVTWRNVTRTAAEGGAVRVIEADVNGRRQAEWATLLDAGTYSVFATWTASTENVSSAQISVERDGSQRETTSINQRAAAGAVQADGLAWRSLGKVRLTKAEVVRVLLSSTARGLLVADAVKFVKDPG